MKQIFRRGPFPLFLLLLMFLLLPPLLSACESGPAEITAETTAAPDPAADALVLAADGQSPYVIVIDKFDRDDLADPLVAAIEEKYGVTLPVSTEGDPDGYEILLGRPDREEIQRLTGLSRTGNDFAVAADGERLVLWGKSNDAAAMAVGWFLDHCLSDGPSLLVPRDTYYYFCPAFEDSLCYRLVSGYKWVRSLTCGDRIKLAQDQLSEAMEDLTGKKPSVGFDGPIKDLDTAVGFTAAKPEVLLGPTNRTLSMQARADLGPDDYRITIKDGSFIVVGGSSFSTAAAAGKFLELLQTGVLYSPEQEFELVYRTSDYRPVNPLCADPSSFVPVWADSYTPPEWLTDMKESLFQMTRKNSGPTRLCTVAHRGDFSYYPEDSVEGILSAVMAGADAVEIDVRFTKDGVPVLMHDDTLNRTTDWAEKFGRPGLPRSNVLANWTFEELCRLNLKTNNGKVTQYKIPTLYEALAVCAGRTQIKLDNKTVSDTNKAVFANTTQLDHLGDLYDVARAANALDTLFIQYGAAKCREMTLREDAPEDFIRMYQYFNLVHSDGGGIVPTYAQWSDPRYAGMSSLYVSQIEDPYLWDLRVQENHLFTWTNMIVKCSQYISIAPGMTPGDYRKFIN